ncbi:MAG: FKBP-type peptidyl-prolyl cis-trans isomerase N-terminal domain-containing protein [Bacteroidota bacterium]
MLKHFCTSLLPAFFLLAACGTESPSSKSLQSQNDSLSYLVGMDIARVYSGYEIELDPAIIYQAYQDVLDSSALALDQETANRLSGVLNQQIASQQQLLSQKQAAENSIKSQMFLRDNGTKEDVISLASGLQYRVIEEGTGVPPTIKNEVRVTFDGTLLDGTTFSTTHTDTDSTSVVAVELLLPGLTEALLMMKPGARWELFLPADLGYGNRGKELVPPNAVLVFDIRLLEIVR